MNVRDFREEIAEAYIRGIEFAMGEPPSEAQIAREGVPRPEALLLILKRAANQYATMRVLNNTEKLEPMP